MPPLTTALPKSQEEPERPLTMIVTMQQLISQQHFNLSLRPHLKTNVKTIMYSWGKTQQERKSIQAVGRSSSQRPESHIS